MSGAGELRAHALAGGPFAEGTYVAVTAERPAKARLGAIPPSAAARADVVCVARAPEEAGRACPLSIRVGDGEPRRPELGEDGRATVSLDLAAGSPAVLEMAMGPGPGKWVALARVVFDREVPGAKLEEGVGWVLEPPHVERRFLLAPGEPLTVHGVTGLVRVDASSEPGERARVIASAGGRERVLPADGSAATLAVTAGAPLVLRASGGAVTVAVAQRERLEADDDGGEEVDPSPPPSRAPRADPPVAGVALDLASPAVTRDIAERSPPPLSGLESSLGTLATRTFAVYGTLREGLPSVPNGDADGYAGAAVDYLRRVESLDLWTHAGVLGRVRRGTPTGGATATLYEDADRIHTRVTGTVDAFTQSVAGQGVVTVKPRGFVEYSLRATRTFFVLPRLGYDGAYSTLSAPARSLANVDDDVHNPYRVKRPTFAFAQALLWWTPYFNDIFYLRSRATYDPVAGEVSHLSSRPGFFAAFGDVDLSGFVDTTWYAPSSSLRSSERLDATAGFKWAYTLWRNLGSFALQPGASGAYRVTDGGWQVAVYVNLLTSYRRGLRDYSSLDLDFPEQLGGSIPWRGATPGGYR